MMPLIVPIMPALAEKDGPWLEVGDPRHTDPRKHEVIPVFSTIPDAVQIEEDGRWHWRCVGRVVQCEHRRGVVQCGNLEYPFRVEDHRDLRKGQKYPADGGPGAGYQPRINAYIICRLKRTPRGPIVGRWWYYNEYTDALEGWFWQGALQKYHLNENGYRDLGTMVGRDGHDVNFNPH